MADRVWSVSRSVFSQFAHEVNEHLMGVLNEGRVVTVHQNGVITEILAWSAGAPEQANGHCPCITCGLKGLNEIVTSAAGGHDEQDIIGPQKGTALPGEDGVVAEIVGDARQGGGISIEADGRQGRSVSSVSAYEFFRKMERLSGRSSISSRVEHAIAFQSLQ